jgi:hypothetical protein
MTADHDDGPRSAERRGVGRFDALRTLTDAHRRAVESADASFRMFAGFLDGRARSDAPVSNGDGPADDEIRTELHDDPLGFADLRRGITRSLDLYLELAERFFDASARSLEDALRVRGVTVTGGGRDPEPAPLRIEGRPGERVSVPIWLHNLTDDALTERRYVVTDLVSHTGAVVPAAATDVAADCREPVAPGASVSADLTITLGADTPLGIYVGHVLLAPVADAALPVRLLVHENGDGAH